jgi:hypothetical protein
MVADGDCSATIESKNVRVVRKQQETMEPRLVEAVAKIYTTDASNSTQKAEK